MRSFILPVVGIAAAVVAGHPALAKHDGGLPPGQAKKLYGGPPPGLADKPYGLPPGQAKKLWRRGERLPPAYYRDQTYYVPDWRAYRLRPPPRGYRWVRVDDQYVLASVATGVILDLLAR